MNRPKMVIFDAGRTLIDYVSVDTLKGVQALMPYIVSNPRNLTAEEINFITNRTFDHFEAARKQLFEVPAPTILKLAYDLMDIRLSVSMEEAEKIIWNEDAVIEIVEGSRDLLDSLHDMGIRTAVISNLDFSGYLLRERLNELFPGNHFEFVVASSDCGVRKPTKLLFEAGIARSGLKPDEIWYVGDKVQVDVAGSSACGITPVLYQFKRNTYGELPEGLISIDDYSELAAILRECD